MDGASSVLKGAGCSGIIQNNSGDCIGGYYKNVKICSTFCGGVLEGLRLARRLELEKVEICVDSMLVAEVIIDVPSNDV